MGQRLVELMLSRGVDLNKPYAFRSRITEMNKPIWMTIRIVDISKNKRTAVLSPSVVNCCGLSLTGQNLNFVQFLN